MNKKELTIQEENYFFSIEEACEWATKYLRKKVTKANITYLIQYGQIINHGKDQNHIKIRKKELKEYYDKNIKNRSEKWIKKLGRDINWNLSFDHLKESERTKHVHRLHPYKGKFIPQLVEYFLDDHINNFKQKVYFKKGDIILDPFMGSGTTLVQCAELGLNCIGIDISVFNCLIASAKMNKYNIEKLESILLNAYLDTKKFSESNFGKVNGKLKEKMHEFNNKFFPSPEFKIKVKKGLIDEKTYAKEKLKLFLEENKELLEENDIKNESKVFNDENVPLFLKYWFSNRIRQELIFYKNLISKIEDEKIKTLMKVILSRTARSCRATTHFDLATLKKPQIGPYYCIKHMKICTPVNSILKHLRRYTIDTIKRLKEFSELRKDIYWEIITGDSRKIDIFNENKNKNPSFFKLLKEKKIAGIFTSPPYLGQINYHEQHAYAYELFNLSRRDEEEIGPLFKGKTKKAQEEYIKGISDVLTNIKRFIKKDGHFFIVANDKLNLYPKIAEKSGLKIINQFKRPVLDRTERDRQPYGETIFYMIKND